VSFQAFSGPFVAWKSRPEWALMGFKKAQKAPAKRARNAPRNRAAKAASGGKINGKKDGKGYTYKGSTTIS